MSVKVIGNRVLVETVQEQSHKQGSLYIPGTAMDGFKKGKVVSVGTGHWENGVRIPVEAVAGDEILFSEHGAVQVSVDGKDYILIAEVNVLAILN